MAEEYDLPLKMNNTGARGIHVQINIAHNKNFSVQDLPSVFIQVIFNICIIHYVFYWPLLQFKSPTLGLVNFY